MIISFPIFMLAGLSTMPVQAMRKSHTDFNWPQNQNNGEKTAKKLHPEKNLSLLGERDARNAVHSMANKSKPVGTHVAALPSHVPLGKGSATDLFARGASNAIWNRTALFERFMFTQSSSAMSGASQNLTIGLAVAAATFLSFVMCCCSLACSRTRKEGKFADVKIEDLVKRLSQTVWTLTQPGSSHQLPRRKRRTGLWWGASSHAWAKTRLGCWESEQDQRRGTPVVSVFLKDVSQVSLTDDADTCCDPGVCITYKGESGRERVCFFFETHGIAEQYIEDLTVLIKKVKKAGN